MARIKTNELARRVQLDGLDRTVCHLQESLDKGLLRPADFHIRPLFEALVPDGREWIDTYCRKGNDGGFLMEAGAVDTAAFRNISGQVVYSATMEAYVLASQIGARLCRTIQTQLNGEKIPGISQLGDKSEIVGEGQPYPLVGVGEDWVDTPETIKRGLIVPITKEALFFDRTGLLLDRCRAVGESIGINKEKRILDMVLGVTNNYKWKGTAYDTYQATTPWINTTASNSAAAFIWTKMDAVLQIFQALTDPNTAEPIVINPRQIICNGAYTAGINAILNATQVIFDQNANAGTAQYQTWTPNPIGRYEIFSNGLINARYTAGSVTATSWFCGDFQRAFAYMENWPITVEQDTGGDLNFSHDIVMRFKASERGVPAVMDPRYVNISNA